MPGVTINIEARGPVVVMSEGSTLNLNNNHNSASSTGRAHHTQQAIPSSSVPRTTSALPRPAQQPYAAAAARQMPAFSPRPTTSSRMPSQNSTAASPSSSSSNSRPRGPCRCSRCQQQQQQPQQPQQPPTQKRCQCSRCQQQYQQHRHAHAHAHAHRHEHHHTVRVEHVSGSKGPSQQGYQGSKHVSAFSEEDDRLDRNKRRRYD